MEYIATSVVATPTDALARRVVGKAAWKSMLQELIDSEREDLADLKMLLRHASDPATMRLISSLYERKVERVIELNLLLRYKDREKEEAMQVAP